MLEPTNKFCQNQNHISFFNGNGYNDHDNSRFPLIDVNVTEDNTGNVQKSTWCSCCLTANALLNSVEELCSCGHHKCFHDLEVGEKQQNTREDRRFNICFGGGPKLIRLDWDSDKSAIYEKYRICKNFQPTKLRLPKKSDSNCISGQ